MNTGLRIALARLRHHPAIALLLSISLGISLSIPISGLLIISGYRAKLIERATETPFVVGALGSKVDLTLGALAFLPTELKPISIGDLEKSAGNYEGLFIPMNLFFTAKNYLLVGTTKNYFTLRNLTPSFGKLPSLPSEVALGHRVAKQLNAKVGTTLITQQRQLSDLSEPQSIILKVSGILKKKGTPDDDVIFTPIETSWMASGHLHVHESPESLDIDHEEIQTSRSITSENVDELHGHGNKKDFPITLAIFIPENKKSATIVPSRIDQKGSLHAPDPKTVVSDLLTYVVRIRDLVLVITGVLLTASIFLAITLFGLDLKMRKQEFNTLRAIGISKGSVRLLIFYEITVIAISAMLITLCAIGLLTQWAPGVNNILS